MKICWDNIKNMYMSNRGNLRIDTTTFIEMPNCGMCGEPYLARREKYGLEKFCDRECCGKFKVGSKHTLETKQKMSKSSIGHSRNTGRKHSEEWKKKMSFRQIGEKHYNYKGNVSELNLPLFDTYNEKINYAEDVSSIYVNGLKLLQVKCSKCKKWFVPTTSEVWRRILSLEGRRHGECKFYCSDRCKSECDIFNTKLYPRTYNTNHKLNHSLWSCEVLKRANYECEYCGEKSTQAHHIKPQKLEPFFALDPDYGLACCEKCHHKYGHKDECSTGSLAYMICGGNQIA
jgi:hypothetical protein